MIISITFLAELALCYILPIKFTLSALASFREEPIEQKKWAIFWAIVMFLMLIENMVPFLKQYSVPYSSAPFAFLKTLFVVWMYHPEFMGSLLIGQIVESKLRPFSAQINGILSKLNFLHLVEADPVKKHV